MAEDKPKTEDNVINFTQAKQKIKDIKSTTTVLEDDDDEFFIEFQFEDDE
tara:strand:- start:2464 stop:2613 length:150 start_codon:yes stop_codon:yes gene_type:complete